MENNQMNQFFNGEPVQQDLQQPQQQFNQQPQFQEIPVNQFNYQKNTYAPLQNNERVSPKVFKLALIGSSVALIGAAISLVLAIIAYSISLNLVAPQNYKSGISAVLFYAICGLIIGIVFTSLTVLLRKMKSKAPAVIMIVFSSIFLAIWGIGLFMFPYFANNIQTGYGSITVSHIVALQPSLGTLLLIANCSIIPGVISIGGWIALLISGIMGVRISSEELKMNSYL